MQVKHRDKGRKGEVICSNSVNVNRHTGLRDAVLAVMKTATIVLELQALMTVCNKSFSTDTVPVTNTYIVINIPEILES